MTRISQLPRTTSITDQTLFLVTESGVTKVVTFDFIKNNIIGPTGYSGSGGQGYTGSSSGFTGSGGQGYSGSQGSPGQNGFGFAGSRGNLGYAGSAGAGFAGSVGSRGYGGSNGTNGFTGSAGRDGASASQGYVGSSGPGFIGSRGTSGYTGSAGPSGASASQGYAGSQGPAGPSGGYTGSAGAGSTFGSRISIGTLAGQSAAIQAVGIGYRAGETTQGDYTTAVGTDAGRLGQGIYSTAIGYNAGSLNQAANSISINASGNGLNPTTSGLFIDPIRNVTSATNYTVFYNTSTKEVVYSAISTTGLAARTTSTQVTSTLANSGSGNITITGFKTYALYKIKTDYAAWVRLYTTSAARTSDASRTQGTDPVPGSGVIAEVITTGATTQLITPGVIGFNDDTTPTTNIYATVTNLSGSSVAITVTLTIAQLES